MQTLLMLYKIGKNLISLQSDYLMGKYLEPRECCVNSCAFGRVQRLVNQYSSDFLNILPIFIL